MKIKKEDTVIVITGKDKGKTGKVISINASKQTVKVKGINVQTKHKKQTRTARSEIKHQEGPISVSNVLYYDSKTAGPTRIGYRFEDGKRIRFAKKTGEDIE
jgi:large subunit ribosomal protein L24